ncbi:MAG: insulinase family protein [Candidatus Kapaibacterium sp.]
MKLLIRSLALFLALSSVALAQKIDVTKRPDPLPAKSISFPPYKEIMLKNGLKVFLVEDHEQPTVAFTLQIRSGETSDGAKAGLANITADMLTKGAGKRTALEIAEKLDSIAIGIQSGSVGEASTMSFSGLKKHFPLALSIASDMIIRPTFPQEELDKMIPQVLAEIKQEKSRPNNIAAAMSRKVIYGMNHPNARRRTDQSVKSITVEDLKKFHSTYYKPNNATLAIVGDISEKDLIPMLEKALKDWKKGDVPKAEVPPPSPMPVGTYFIPRPGSAQSSIMTVSLGVPYRDPNFETLSLCADVMGGSFGGRLFRTLRETYSYTYTPGAFMTSGKNMNRFACMADVRNAVTDSAIAVIKQELERLSTEKVPDEELTRMKRYIVGRYLLSFERSEFIANLLQFADYTGRTIAEIKAYPERFMALSPAQVQAAAQKYLRKDQTSTIVVGSPDVLPVLKKMGPVVEYSLDLEPMVAGEKVDISVQDLFQKHIQALGGKDKIDAVKSLIISSKAALEAGPQKLEGTFVRKLKSPGMERTSMDLKVMKQDSWVSGDKAWTARAPQPAQELPPAEAAKKRTEATILMSAKLLDLGYKAEVTAKKDGQYVVNITTPSSDKEVYYFDAKTFLLTQIERTVTQPQGAMPVTVKFSDYTNVGGVMFPKKSSTENPNFTISHEFSYDVNPAIDDKEFAP